MGNKAPGVTTQYHKQRLRFAQPLLRPKAINYLSNIKYRHAGEQEQPGRRLHFFRRIQGQEIPL
jgi:hypothetical protein